MSEPTSLSLFGIVLIGLGFAAWRHKINYMA
ncbi:PEP-CTERM sorting domain-containing protein [Nitrosomonas mobilis]